jgi:hypothetical protein
MFHVIRREALPDRIEPLPVIGQGLGPPELKGKEPPLLGALWGLVRGRRDLVAKALEQRAHTRGELLAVAGVVSHRQCFAGRSPRGHDGVETGVIHCLFEAIAKLRVDQAQEIPARAGRRSKRHQPRT